MSSIPKVIHYCWFGGNPLPKSARQYIDSWKKNFPGYEIKEWNESNFDVNVIPYTAAAYKDRKYAFVSDYARFWILYNYGGVYFDTDVEVRRPLLDIIEKGPCMGPSEGEVETLENENKEQSSTIKSLKSTNKELQAKVDEAKPWFELSDIEKEQQLAAAKEAEEKRLAEEKAQAEAEAQAKAEAEAQAKAEAEEKERIGYNTGITYDQLARRQRLVQHLD